MQTLFKSYFTKYLFQGYDPEHFQMVYYYSNLIAQKSML